MPRLVSVARRSGKKMGQQQLKPGKEILEASRYAREKDAIGQVRFQN